MWPACGVVAFAIASAVAGPDQVAHEGEWLDGSVRWQTEWRADRLVHDVQLAAPLPPGAEVQGAVPERDEDGQIVGVDVDPPAVMGSFEVVLPQDLDADALAVPLVADAGVQRVILDDLAFTPDPSLGFDKHIRYWAPPAIDSAGRKAFERRWRRSGGRSARPGDQAVYLRTDDRFTVGIPGRLSPAGQVSWAVHGLLGLTLLVLFGGAGLLYRSLERQARAERNDWYIREHLGAEEADAQ